MATSRYYFLPTVNGTRVATTAQTTAIFNAVDAGAIPSQIYQLSDTQRLDQLAGSTYGDSSLWWIIAAASGIGWGLQLPAGTIVRVPTDLTLIYNILRNS